MHVVSHKELTGFPVLFLLWQAAHLFLKIGHFLHQRHEPPSYGEVIITIYASLLIQLYTWQNGEISKYGKYWIY